MIIGTIYKDNKILKQITDKGEDGFVRPFGEFINEATSYFYKKVAYLVDVETFKEDVMIYVRHINCEYGSGIGYEDGQTGTDYYLSFELVETSSEEAIKEKLEAKAKNAETKKAYSKAKRASRTTTRVMTATEKLFSMARVERQDEIETIAERLKKEIEASKPRRVLPE